MATRDGAGRVPETVGALLCALERLGAVATRRIQWLAVGTGTLSKVCTFCGHRETLDVLDLDNKPMSMDKLKVLAAELDGAPNVCRECSDHKGSPAPFTPGPALSSTSAGTGEASTTRQATGIEHAS